MTGQWPKGKKGTFPILHCQLMYVSTSFCILALLGQRGFPGVVLAGLIARITGTNSKYSWLPGEE